MAPPRPPRTKIKHFHGQQSEDIEAGLGEKLNSNKPLLLAELTKHVFWTKNGLINIEVMSIK